MVPAPTIQPRTKEVKGKSREERDGGKDGEKMLEPPESDEGKMLEPPKRNRTNVIPAPQQTTSSLSSPTMTGPVS